MRNNFIFSLCSITDYLAEGEIPEVSSEVMMKRWKKPGISLGSVWDQSGIGLGSAGISFGAWRGGAPQPGQIPALMGLSVLPQGGGPWRTFQGSSRAGG